MIQLICIAIAVAIGAKISTKRFTKKLTSMAQDEAVYRKERGKMWYTGFIKNYAKKTNLNLDQIDYDKFKEVNGELLTFYVETTKKNMKVIYIICGILIVVVGVRLAYLMSQM